MMFGLRYHLIVKAIIITCLIVTSAHAAQEIEVNNNTSTATSLPFGITTTGSLSTSSDIDFYAIRLYGDGMVSVSFDHEILINYPYFEITMLDGAGNTLLYISSTGAMANTVRRIGLKGQPGSGTTYYVKVAKGTSYIAAPYSISVNFSAGDYEIEQNDAAGASSTTLRVGTPKIGYLQKRNKINSLRDTDYYCLELAQPGLVTLTFDHDVIPSGLHNYHISLLDSAANKTYLYIPSYGNTTHLTRRIGLPAGKYYVLVEAADELPWETGIDPSYTIKFNHAVENYEQEPNDQADSTATVLPLNVPTVGHLQKLNEPNSSRDRDLYRFNLQQTGLVTLTFSHDPINSGAQYFIVQILNSSGLVSHLYLPSSGNTTQLTRRIGLLAGDYFVLVQADASNLPCETGIDPSYTIQLSHTSGSYEQEPNDQADPTVTVLPLNVPTSGYLQKLNGTNSSRDRDWYRFNLPQAGLVTLTFSHDPINSGAQYFIVQILNSSGLVSHLYLPSSGNTTQLTRRIGLPKGDYFVLVQADASNLPCETGIDPSYTIKLNHAVESYEQEPNDQANPTATVLPFNVPTSGYLQKLNGTNSSRDRDLYRFNLPQAGLVTLTFSHDPINSGAQYFIVQILNSSGLVIHLYLPSSGNATQLTRRIGLPRGDYFVLVQADASNLPCETGIDPSYTIELNHAVESYEQEPNDQADSTATFLPFNVSTIGYLQKLNQTNSTKDRDCYQIALTQQGSVIIEFSHTNIPSAGSWWTVSLVDAAGVQIKNWNVSGTGNIADVVNDLSGGSTYYIIVSWGASFADDKEYQLKVSAIPAQTVITAKPASLMAQKTAQFSFISSESSATFECKVDNANFFPCSAPYDLLDLGEGMHSFTVRAVINGTPDPDPPFYLWTVDTIIPLVTITSQPTGSSSSGEVRFYADETGCAYECSLNGSDFASCSSPYKIHDWSEGAYGFTVRAIDPAGNMSTPTTAHWIVDLPPFGTRITSSQAGITSDSFATFTFACDDPSATSFECSLDGGAFETCATGRQYQALPDGPHTFRVRALDATGNVDPYPATQLWIVGQYVKLLVGGKLPSYHFTIGEACNSLTQEAGASEAEIQLKGQVFYEDAELILPLILKVSGGYGDQFRSQSAGESTIDGRFSIVDGSVTIDSIMVK